MSKILKIQRKFVLLAPKVSLRTGAWQPLSKFSGWSGTRGTRTAPPLPYRVSMFELCRWGPTFDRRRNYFGLISASSRGNATPKVWPFHRLALTKWFNAVAIWVNPDFHLDFHLQAKLKFTVPLAWNTWDATISLLVRFVFGKTKMLIFD